MSVPPRDKSTKKWALRKRLLQLGPPLEADARCFPSEGPAGSPLCEAMVARRQPPRLSVLTVAVILTLHDEGATLGEIVHNVRVRKRDGTKLSREAKWTFTVYSRMRERPRERGRERVRAPPVCGSSSRIVRTPLEAARKVIKKHKPRRPSAKGSGSSS